MRMLVRIVDRIRIRLMQRVGDALRARVQRRGWQTGGVYGSLLTTLSNEVLDF